jgi:hypothetical protein
MFDDLKWHATRWWDKHVRLCQCTIVVDDYCWNKAQWMLLNYRGVGKHLYACASCKEVRSYYGGWCPIDDSIERPITPCVQCGECHLPDDPCEND